MTTSTSAYSWWKEILHHLRHTKTWEIMGINYQPQLLRRILTIQGRFSKPPNPGHGTWVRERHGSHRHHHGVWFRTGLGWRQHPALAGGGVVGITGIGDECWKPKKNTHKKQNMRITRIKHVFVFFLEASLPFWWGSKCWCYVGGSVTPMPTSSPGCLWTFWDMYTCIYIYTVYIHMYRFLINS